MQERNECPVWGDSPGSGIFLRIGRALRALFFCLASASPDGLRVSLIRLPGLIDPHVHLRQPGATHKEDFDSGTAAALAGGFTTVLAMPNPQPPLTDRSSLDLAKSAAQDLARCDYGIFLGAGDSNAGTAAALAPEVCGLKMYLDQTYGPLQLKDLAGMRAHVAAWPTSRVLAAHAEGRSLAAVLLLASLYDRPVHICHVSRRVEIELIRRAKERGLPVTCEVTPHHLLLTERDAAGLGHGRGEVRPTLASRDDQQALWDNLEVIDCFATDHAPHTPEEKDGPNPPPGFPGLETALGLMLTAMNQGRLTLQDLVSRMVERPGQIYGLPPSEDTWIEVDAKERWEVKGAEMFTRSRWSPFEGRTLTGRVRRVMLRGRLAYEDGRVLAEPGTGRDVFAAHES